MLLGGLERTASVWSHTICTYNTYSRRVFNRRRSLWRLRRFFLLLTGFILENFVILLTDYLTITSFIITLLHTDLMMNGMHLLNMLDCAHIGTHFRVCWLLDLVLEILRWKALLGKHLLCLPCCQGHGIKVALAGFFRTQYMLIHKLTRIL